MTAVLDLVAIDPAVDVVRAWKEVDYRASLSPEQLAALPESPVGDLQAIETGEIYAGESVVISIVSPAGCLLTLACTSPCCAW